MKRRSLLVLLAVSVIAGLMVCAIAVSNTTYTWEKTFEVKEPEIECKIEIGDNRIIGCPVRIWVCLRLNSSCDDCWCHGWKEELDDDQEDNCKEWRHGFECDNLLPIPINECCCHVNGTYSAHLYWWNQTSEDWDHLMDLQEDTNVTLTCGRYMRMYSFIPKMEGEYKVVVNFTVDSETYTFTNED